MFHKYTPWWAGSGRGRPKAVGAQEPKITEAGCVCRASWPNQGTATFRARRLGVTAWMEDLRQRLDGIGQVCVFLLGARDSLVTASKQLSRSADALQPNMVQCMGGRILLQPLVVQARPALPPVEYLPARPFACRAILSLEFFFLRLLCCSAGPWYCVLTADHVLTPLFRSLACSDGRWRKRLLQLH